MSNKDKKAIKTLDDAYKILDERIYDLVHTVQNVVDSLELPEFYGEYEASWFRWITLVNSRMTEMSIAHAIHIQEEHIDEEDGRYYLECDQKHDSEKLKGHIGAY